MFNSYLRTRLFVEELQCLLNFNNDAGRQGIEIYTCIKFYSAFLCHLHAHTCPLYNVLLKVVCCCFPRNELHVYMRLNVTLFVGSQSYISPPSFMFVTAAVSEIHKLNQNKKE